MKDNNLNKGEISNDRLDKNIMWIIVSIALIITIIVLFSTFKMRVTEDTKRDDSAKKDDQNRIIQQEVVGENKKEAINSAEDIYGQEKEEKEKKEENSFDLECNISDETLMYADDGVHYCRINEEFFGYKNLKEDIKCTYYLDGSERKEGDVECQIDKENLIVKAKSKGATCKIDLNKRVIDFQSDRMNCQINGLNNITQFDLRN
jgi:hypothetical protein